MTYNIFILYFDGSQDEYTIEKDSFIDEISAINDEMGITIKKAVITIS